MLLPTTEEVSTARIIARRFKKRMKAQELHLALVNTTD